MKSFLQFPFLCAAAFLMLTGTGFAWQDNVQEDIEIVDQDGQKISPQKFKVVTKQSEKKQGDAAVTSAIDIESKDGKIVIIDSDGTRREIDVTGAQNIIVNKSVQSIMKNGEQQQQVTGRAIIIGPDGDRQEFFLGGGQTPEVDVFVPEIGGFQGVFEMLPQLEGQFGDADFGPRKFVFGMGPGRDAGKFMIGVNCNPVSEQLRAHLDLAEGTGLVVSSIVDADSPAGKAGLQIHDILIYADQEDLGTTKDLVDAVQLAGKESREMTLTLLRRGKETSIEVKPVERKQTARMFDGMPGNAFQFEKIGPGILMEAEVEAGEMNEAMKRMREQFEQVLQQHLEEMRGIRKELSDSIELQKAERDDK